MVPYPIIFLVWLDGAVCTAAFYGWILLFVFLALRNVSRARHWSLAVLFAAIACLPALWYWSAYSAATTKHAQLNQQLVDAQALPKLTNPPRTLVLDSGGRSEWLERLVEMGAFDEIILNWQGLKTRIANSRNDKCDGGARGNVSVDNFYRSRTGYLVCAVETATANSPESGLHLYMTQRHQIEHDWTTYFDLWMVEGGQRRLVGFHGTPYVHYPVFPPALNSRGFQYVSSIVKGPVEWRGEIPFLFERLGLDIDTLKPLLQPAPDEIRAQFLRLRDSPQRPDQRVAGFIAKAVGASALSADDVLPVMRSDAIDYDFGRLVGSLQFCSTNNRLCDYAEQMAAVCKAKSKPDPLGHYPNASRLCDRIPEQCNRCRTAQLCQPYLTGKTAGCSTAEDAAGNARMIPLKQF